MNSALLVAHFDRISKAPDAVLRLRGFIRDLAVRGKLVEQNPSEEPAETLLNEIRSAKGLSNSAPVTEIRKANDHPFEVPDNWVWSRLGEICSKTGSGSTPRGGKTVYQLTGIPFLRSQNIYNDGLRLDDVAYITAETHNKMAGTAVRPGDLLLNITGGSIGRSCIVPPDFSDANVSQHVAIIRPAIDGLERYIHQLILSPYFQSFVIDEQTGAGRGGLPKNRMDRIPVALPPISEQLRIVAKVDELMALCDRLDKTRREEDSRREAASLSALHHLSNGTSPEDLRDRSKFYLDHIVDFASQPSQISALRRTILALAVQGRLVTQDPSDELPSELLKRIQRDKQERIVLGTLRKEKPLRAVAKDEVPFVLPESWIWARIGTCALLTEYGTSVRSDEQLDGVPVLAMGNIQDGDVILHSRKKVSRQIEDLPQLLLKRFDLLYNRTNSAELVGKTGIYLGDDDAFTFASYLIRIRFNRDLMNPSYVNLAMNASYFRETQIVPELRQQCGQANVNGTKLRNMLIPIPPIAEQARIVARVEELMALCNRLETRLSTVQKQNGALLESVLHHALVDVGTISMASASS